jgi:hypothetical protein
MEEVMNAKNDSAKNEDIRKRVLFLGGSGEQGRSRVRRLVTSDLVSEVGIAGRNLEKLDRAVTEIGNKAHAVQVDILDEHRLVSVAADYDLILNTAGPEYEVLLPALRGAIAAGKHYCDIGGDGPTVEKQLELDSMAKERDIVAIPGIGGSALMNLLALHAYQQFDRTEEIQICNYANQYFLWQVNHLQESGRIDTSLQLVPNMLSKPACIYRDARWAEVDARESGVSVALPKGGIVTAYPLSHSNTITLPRYLTGIRNASVVLGVPNPHLADLMFSMAGQISSGKLTDKAATRSFIETIGKDPDHWLEAPPGPLSTARWELWIVVTGWKEGRRGRYTYWPTKWVPPLVVAALCIMRGDVSERGVLPPEACFEPQSFFDEMVSLMPDPPSDGKWYGESFEWLE